MRFTYNSHIFQKTFSFFYYFPFPTNANGRVTLLLTVDATFNIPTPLCATQKDV